MEDGAHEDLVAGGRQELHQVEEADGETADSREAEDEHEDGRQGKVGGEVERYKSAELEGHRKEEDLLSPVEVCQPGDKGGREGPASEEAGTDQAYSRFGDTLQMQPSEPIV